MGFFIITARVQCSRPRVLTVIKRALNNNFEILAERQIFGIALPARSFSTIQKSLFTNF
jgi:hypothetical protein